MLMTNDAYFFGIYLFSGEVLSSYGVEYSSGME